MINLLNALLADIAGVLKAGISVAAIAWVAIVWWRSKSLVNTLSAIIMAGVVVWATANVDYLKSRIGEDAQQSGGSEQIDVGVPTVSDLLGA